MYSHSHHVAVQSRLPRDIVGLDSYRSPQNASNNLVLIIALLFCILRLQIGVILQYDCGLGFLAISSSLWFQYSVYIS